MSSGKQAAHTAQENGFQRERVADFQRGRMLVAMVALVAERGVANVTVADIVERSGVSRRTFYDIFEDREDCLLAALDDALARVSDSVVHAYRSGGSWAERLRLALIALLSFLDVERGVGRLLIVESLGAGARALEYRQRVLAQITTVIDEGRTQVNRGDGPPPLTAEGIVGAVLSIVHARLLTGPAVGNHRTVQSAPSPLTELVNPLMGMIVLPYLGTAASRRELAKPVPSPAPPLQMSGDPLKDIQMRLTYRTLRVLIGLSADPRASNRQIGEVAGVSDQGQISKLLTRLQRLGLIENTIGVRSRGGPNAWALSAQGQEIVRSVHKTDRDLDTARQMM